MHEETHISYGDGRVDIVLDSASLTEVAAPKFRFGDYDTVVESCFSGKELGLIEEGDCAELTFSFVVSDAIDDAAVMNRYEEAIERYEKVYGNLHEGIYVETSALKEFNEEASSELTTSNGKVELQMDVPLFLVKENRQFYFLTDDRGGYELLIDSDPDAEVLTVQTDTFSSGILLYQDKAESLVKRKDPVLRIESRYVFMGGIILLIFLWFAVDHMHRRSGK